MPRCSASSHLWIAGSSPSLQRGHLEGWVDPDRLSTGRSSKSRCKTKHILRELLLLLLWLLLLPLLLLMLSVTGCY